MAETDWYQVPLRLVRSRVALYRSRAGSRNLSLADHIRDLLDKDLAKYEMTIPSTPRKGRPKKDN